MKTIKWNPIKPEKPTLLLFDTNRPLEILCIHSELICQNDAIQKYRNRVRVPKRYTKFRYEKLYRMAEVITDRRFTEDKDWFLENAN